ncbi:MAG: aldo/keto reductase [Deltaproteobacteria bacterium]|nr:aldo/keto reductase [Deltaproteobacteria bacterium]
MIYSQLGRSGLKVSRLSLGSWVTYGGQVDKKEAKRCIHAAFDAGINFFDNAEAYGEGEAERVVGKILSHLPREQLVISSKVFWGGEGPNDVGLSRKHVVEACNAALKRLRLDYLDLYLCHRPDPNTPVLETALAMDNLIRQGKVMYWGTSEWSADQLREAYAVCDAHHLIAPTCEQPQYNLFHRERVEVELAPLYAERGLGTTVWSPLASGLLTGKYNEGMPKGSRLSAESMDWLRDLVITPVRIAQVKRLQRVADELDCSLAQLSLAWAARPDFVSTVITGASRVEQVIHNLLALDVVPQLTPDVLAAIDAVLADDSLDGLPVAADEEVKGANKRKKDKKGKKKAAAAEE